MEHVNFLLGGAHALAHCCDLNELLEMTDEGQSPCRLSLGLGVEDHFSNSVDEPDRWPVVQKELVLPVFDVLLRRLCLMNLGLIGRPGDPSSVKCYTPQSFPTPTQPLRRINGYTCIFSANYVMHNLRPAVAVSAVAP